MKITIEDKENEIRVSVEKPAVNLTEFLELIECAIRASGFEFSGKLEVVKDE